MYEIVNVVYGTVVDEHLYARIDEKMSKIDPDWTGDRMDDLLALGFDDDYHGNGDPPIYLAVKITSWGAYQVRPFVNYEVTDEMVAEYQKKVDAIVEIWPDMAEFLDSPKLQYYGSSS